MNTISLWKSITPKQTEFPSLQEDLEIDIAIVGAGITGILTAYQLMSAGKKVAVFEKDKIAENTTGFSTGNLYVAVQPLYQHVQSKFSLKTAHAVAKSRQAAIDFIERLVVEHHLNCHFERRPWYLHTDDKKKIRSIEKEADFFANAGFKIEDEQQLNIPLPFKKAIRMDNQARINPMQFTVLMADILKDKGCLIFEDTPIRYYEEKDAHCILMTDQHKIKANKMVLATHVPLGINHKQMLMGPYRSYVVAAKLADKQYPNGNYWDLSSPHHAMSTHSEGTSMAIDTLAVAGSHHKTGQDKNTLHNFAALEEYIRSHFKVEKIAYRWSAQHYQAADKLPYIGFASHSSKHIYMATGFFADGLVYGALSALILSDMIVGRENQWQSAFDSNRFTPFASAPAFIKESSNVFIQYMKDYPGQHDVPDANQIEKGQGKIIESQGEKIAAYRDPDGKLHCVSAVCTHMKCIVSWNNAELTWDCPCHGSRFTTDGKVIEGPALIPLAKKELKK